MVKKKEEQIEKVVKEKKPTARLESFTFETVVSTGAYSNIKTIMSIKAETIEDAIELTRPHIRKLYQDYFLMTERRITEPKVDVQVNVVPIVKKELEPTKVVVDGAPTGMIVEITEAYKKASSAIDNAVTVEALELILGQVGKSTKLSGFEKDKLSKIILSKIKIVK